MSRGGRGVVLSSKVGLEPVNWGMSAGLLARIHWRVCVGRDIVREVREDICKGFEGVRLWWKDG